MKRPSRVVRRAAVLALERAQATRVSSAPLRAAARRAAAGRSVAASPVHVLIGPPGNGNIGDQAMVEAFVENVSGRVVVVERGAGDLPVRSSVGGAPVEVVSLPHLVYGTRKDRAADLAAFGDLLQRATSLSVVGADMLDGAYSAAGSVRRLLLAELGALSGVPTRLLGFSWNADPHPAASAALVAAARAGAVPLLRDPHSARRARQLGVPGVVDTADVVFLATTRDDSLAARVRAATGGERLAVVNVSSLVGRSHDQVGEYRSIIRRLSDDGLGVALLPHVLRGSSDDLAACRAVASAVREEVPGVHLVEEQATPAQVRGLTAAAEVVVTGRMHLAIMSLMVGVPAVTFSTQGKVSGLMDLLGTPELCVEPGRGMAERTAAVIASLSSGDLQARVARALPAVTARAQRNLDGLTGEVGR